jgi:hypothetical protein
MRKTMNSLLMLLCLAAALPLAAQSAGTLRQGRYACNGTAFAMQITLWGTGGMATLYEREQIVSNAVIRITGNSVAFTFSTGGDKYRGKTWVYILSGDHSFEGNGESWLRISDGLHSIGPASPSPGSITSPDAVPGGTLQSGDYTLSGGRQRMYMNLAGGTGRGTLYDDLGNIAGEFRITIAGDRLALSFISGRQNGITYDYKILSDTSFSRPGEVWSRRF